VQVAAGAVESTNHSGIESLGRTRKSRGEFVSVLNFSNSLQNCEKLGATTLSRRIADGTRDRVPADAAGRRTGGGTSPWRSHAR
jgi:hypothetical protein